MDTTLGDLLYSTFVTNGKSTLQGICSAVIALSGSAAFIGQLPVKWAASFMAAAGLAKAVIGLLEKDAKNTTPAIVPGVPGVQEVPSHELPDDPRNIPVLK